MKSPLALLASLGLVVGLGLVTAADPPRVNGWYPCSFSTFHAITANMTTLAESAFFECSELEVPLCYDGVCESDRKINLFVKRRVGKAESKDPSVPRKAAILIQGGPGGPSPVMEDVIGLLMDKDNDSIDYYTFDHRGTGRSEFLQCDAAAALTPGSPSGTEPENDEMPTCIEDLNFQYDGQAAAFSVTSAAMDVRMLIDTFLANHDVYAYGMSYGTFLAQRILQLKVPQIKGYVFDGVDVLTTKDDPLESANSHVNQYNQAPARRLLEFCFDDPKCPIKFKARETVAEEMITFLDSLDDGKNECANLVAKAVGIDKPSKAVRMAVGKYAPEFSTRVKGLVVLGAVQRCNADDLKFLSSEAASSSGSGGESPAPPTPAPLNVLVDISNLLYGVVAYSERWAQPPPTQQQRDAFFHDNVAATDADRMAQGFCLQTGSTEPACAELKDALPASKNATFYYKRDKYYDESITLPDGVSALVIGGGLDFATPLEFSELLYSKLKGSGNGVMMVEFDYGKHCNGEAVAEAPVTTCRDSIVRQFIASGGDVAAIDTSCMETLPETAFHLEDDAASASA